LGNILGGLKSLAFSQLAIACDTSNSLVSDLALRFYKTKDAQVNTSHVGKERSFSKGAMHVMRFLVPQNDNYCGSF